MVFLRDMVLGLGNGPRPKVKQKYTRKYEAMPVKYLKCDNNFCEKKCAKKSQLCKT